MLNLDSKSSVGESSHYNILSISTKNRNVELHNSRKMGLNVAARNTSLETKANLGDDILLEEGVVNMGSKA